MKYLVRQLSDARKAKGISQAEMASKIGYEYETLLKIEYGARNPSMSKLVRWAEILGFEVSLNRVSETGAREG